jgi:hypothetical protein
MRIENYSSFSITVNVRKKQKHPEESGGRRRSQPRSGRDVYSKKVVQVVATLK